MMNIFLKRWSRSYEKYGMNNVLTFDIKDKQVLINDNRKIFWHAKSKYILKGKVAEIFLFCQQVRSLKEVRDTFGGINTNDVIEELKKKRLLFVSESECLSLPIRKNV